MPDPKLKAAHDQAQAEARRANKSVADLTAELNDLKARATVTPKVDTERIAALEVDAARSKAALKYGLSLEDAEVLKGTPAEIDRDAKYWSDKLKAQGATPAPEPSNRDIIDKKVAGTPVPDTQPQPKGVDGQSWIERYKQATPAERYKMDEASDAGLVDPTK